MISRFYSFLTILRSNETVKCPLFHTSELFSGVAFKTHRYQNPSIVTLLNFTVNIPRGRLPKCLCKRIYVVFIPQKSWVSPQNSSPEAG